MLLSGLLYGLLSGLPVGLPSELAAWSRWNYRWAGPIREAPPSLQGSRRRDWRRHACALPCSPTSAPRRCNRRLRLTVLLGRRGYEIWDLKFEIQRRPQPPIDVIAA